MIQNSQILKRGIMNKKNLTYLFPAIIITLFIPVFFVIESFIIFDFLGTILIVLTFGFILLFFIQGQLSFSHKANPFLACGVSLAAFLVFLILHLNSSALIYALIYVAMFAIGYVSKKKSLKSI